MATRRKLIARVHQTPVSGDSESRRSTGRMPEELLSEQVQRLAVFGTVAAVLWSFGLFMDTFVLPASSGGVRNWRAMTVESLSVIVAAAIVLYLKLSGATTSNKTAAGIPFVLFNAMGIAALNTWAAIDPSFKPGMQVSWATALILIYSMIAPGSPRRMLLTSLAAASMDPLSYWLAWLRGDAAPTLINGFILSWPNYACAAIAMLPSHVLQRIGRRLQQAQELGAYQLVEPLGTGGMGEVWRAEHRLLARHAAIKLVRPEVLGARNEADARIMLRRFEREAQATAMLSSPHTIQLFDFGITEEGTFYYVMELLSGRDLESLVRAFGPLPANRVVYVLRQVCHSLADAHARGLVHRDIKPANIYVCRMGLDYDFAKVLDFGLVKVKNSATVGDTLSTIEHTTTGTPAYMAPETILGDVEVDRRADVYALGCVAYYLLTGELVFEADTSMKMLMQHLHAPPVPPSQRTELPIPRELDELVLSCLQKDPNLRPQNAGELFRMATNCRAGEAWTADMARSWWEMHLPEFTGPLADAAAKPAATHGATL